MNQRPKMYPGFLMKLTARQAMQRALQLLLVLALIAMLPSLISQTTTILTQADPTALLTDLSDRLTKVQLDSGLEGEALETELLRVLADFSPQLEAYIQEKLPITAITTVATLVLGPMLMIPLIYGCLLAIRKQEFSLSQPLSRLRAGLKALGVSLLSALKTLLWMLPGYAVMIVGALLGMAVPVLGEVLLWGGMAAAIVMGIQAAFRYMMAPYVLADQPGMGVRACIRRSCEIMQRRKFELFALRISYIGWELLLSLAQSLLMGLLGTVLGMTIAMALNLVLQVYIICGQAVFYEVYANGPATMEKAPAEPAPDELN